jgi:hypothetical protein
MLYYMYACSGRSRHALYETVPIDNAHATWIGVESAWALTALPAGSFDCSAEERGQTGKNSAMALRHVRHITSIRYSGSITRDVYEVSKIAHP